MAVKTSAHLTSYLLLTLSLLNYVNAVCIGKWCYPVIPPPVITTVSSIVSVKPTWTATISNSTLYSTSTATSSSANNPSITSFVTLTSTVSGGLTSSNSSSFPVSTTTTTVSSSAFFNSTSAPVSTTTITVSLPSSTLFNSSSFSVSTTTATVGSNSSLVDPIFTNTSTSAPFTTSSRSWNDSSSIPTVTSTSTSSISLSSLISSSFYSNTSSTLFPSATSTSTVIFTTTSISASGVLSSSLTSSYFNASSTVTGPPSQSAPITFTSSGRPTISSSSPPAASTSESAFCLPFITESLIENGDFETGLSPWSVDVVDVLSTSYGLTDTFGAGGSCTAFEVFMSSNSLTDDLTASLRLVPALLLFPRAPYSPVQYTISFSVKFEKSNEAHVIVFANKGEVYRVTSEAVGTDWVQVEFPYNVKDRVVQFEFAFVLSDSSDNHVWFDRVGMEPQEGYEG